MGWLRWGAAALTLAGMACGVGSPPREEPARIAVPPFIAGTLDGAFREAKVPARATALRPYERAQDLEVLLLSSGSSAYEGYVVRATSLPLLRPWLSQLPLDGGGWREDIRDSLKGSRAGWFQALPLCADGPVLLLANRNGALDDLTKSSFGISDLESALERRAEPASGRRLLTTLPPAVLFLALTWSEAGDEEREAFLPERAALRAAAFLQRWFLGPPAALSEGADALARGDAAGLFCWASEADGILARREGFGAILSAHPLPHRGPSAVAPFGGWVLGCPEGTNGRGWLRAAVRRQAGLQKTFQREGLPALSLAGREGPVSAGASVLDQTRFRGIPFSARELEILEQAVADAVEAGIAPDQALRRARARLSAERRGVP